MDGRVTMADVAREAEVSVMTVSRVVNDKGEISPATRQRVLEVIQRLGYRPSAIARGLATNRTGTLGLVVPDIANPFFSDIARGVEEKAYAAGYNVFLCSTYEDPDRESDVLRSLEDKRVDGLLLCSSRLDDAVLRTALAGFPAVVGWRKEKNRGPLVIARGAAVTCSEPSVNCDKWSRCETDGDPACFCTSLH